MCHNIPEINYNYNDRMDQSHQPSRIPYIPINIPEPFPYPFDQVKNMTPNEVDRTDRNNSITSRQRRELDNGGLDPIDDVRVDYTKPLNFNRPVTPKIQKVEQLFPSFHVTYWMFYPYSQVTKQKKINFSISIFHKFIYRVKLCAQ